MTFRLALPCAVALATAPGLVLADATVKPDGQFRYALGAGASYSSGNTSAASANLAADGVRATADSKWTFGGKALWARSEGTTTAENLSLGTQYDHDFTPDWFGFGSADYLRDEFANLADRYAGHGGVGRHLIKNDSTTFDISAGVGYTEDRYIDPADIHGELRGRYGRAEGVVAEESTHKLTQTTSLRQKLSLFPAIGSGGGYRGVFDTGLAVAMTPLLSLTVGLTYRYDSDPGVGFKHGDTLFVTGISMKID
ncbi:MAG TPA: DUF481 domain-containing protein [Caldimonas sp.]|nr:DUF481 domain-containing protein [Caldimonas sp.]